MRCVLLCMLEAVESGLCLLEVLEVMRRGRSVCRRPRRVKSVVGGCSGAIRIE